jgi:WD40 repeat protein
VSSHRGRVFAMAAAPDCGWLATGGSGETVQIWDTATGQPQATLPGHHDWVEAVAASPDGRWLATAGSDGTARIWDTASWQEHAVLTSHRGLVFAVAAAPDGRWLATAGSDGTARIWDTATWQERAVLASHRGSVTAVAAAPDGRWLAVSSHDGTVRIWDTTTWQARALIRVDNSVNTCVWLGANALAVGGLAGLYLFGLLPDTNPTAAGSCAKTLGLQNRAGPRRLGAARTVSRDVTADTWPRSRDGELSWPYGCGIYQRPLYRTEASRDPSAGSLAWPSSQREASSSCSG